MNAFPMRAMLRKRVRDMGNDVIECIFSLNSVQPLKFVQLILQWLKKSAMTLNDLITLLLQLLRMEIKAKVTKVGAQKE